MSSATLKPHPPSVAIVGRTNVGKSTLFNRLCEEKKAIVSDVAGTTRDRNYGSVIWRGRLFVAVDTAGLDVPEKELSDAVRAQIRIAVKNADQLVLVTDVQTSGPTAEDRALAKELIRSRKPVFLAVNKCDGPAAKNEAENPAWRQLGIGPAIPISAVNGTGVGDMLDVLYESFNKLGLTLPEAIEEPATRVTVLGQPNVGKSSIINSMVGHERVVVSRFAGTTREPQDTFVLHDGHPYLLIDTVGIQKKAKQMLEAEGVKRSLEAMRLSDVVYLILDAQRSPGSQDKTLAGEIIASYKGAAIVVNKWDTVVDKTPNTPNEYVDMVRSVFPFLNWAPIFFVSAKTNEKIDSLYHKARAIVEARRKTIPEPELMEWLKKIQTAKMKGMGVAHPKTYRFSQIATEPPTFLLVAKGKTPIPDAYTNFLEKRLREKYDFVGTPIKMQTKTIRGH